jgi:hypothetical protein
MKTLNNLRKKSAAVAACLLVCFFLSGCQLFAVGGQKLSEYCPGLSVKLDGISWHNSGSTGVLILQYDPGYQKKVNAYFADKANGFAGDKPRSYMDIKDGDNAAVADGDSILTKTIDKGKKTATVIYNATTRRIIIVENTEK